MGTNEGDFCCAYYYGFSEGVVLCIIWRLEA